MAEKTHETSKNGLVVVYTGESINTDTGEPSITRWSIPPQQIEKHLPQFASEMKPGDLTAAQDRVSEFQREEMKKERDKRRIF